MPNTHFNFKKFTVQQNNCAMKVGTDSVLLGSWCHINNATNILDIGTGTGILALMLAQKNKSALIKGIDIDAMAVVQAKENCEKSNYANQITIENISLQVLAQKEEHYDLIISNPPFFEDSSKANSLSRTLARHNDSLSYEDLFYSVAKLLKTNGTFYAIFPYNELKRTTEIAKSVHLNINNMLTIFTKASKNPKRVIIQYGFNSLLQSNDSLVIQEEIRYEYTNAYKELTKDFYINF